MDAWYVIDEYEGSVCGGYASKKGAEEVARSRVEATGHTVVVAREVQSYVMAAVAEEVVEVIACVDEKTGMFKILRGGPGCPKGFMERAMAAARKGTLFPADAADAQK